jgi:hypothetical protein
MLDTEDERWASTFVGQSIPEGSTIDGFVSVISWVDPEGNLRWRSYTTFDSGVQSVGLLTMAAAELTYDTIKQSSEESDD